MKVTNHLYSLLTLFLVILVISCEENQGEAPVSIAGEASTKEEVHVDISDRQNQIREKIAKNLLKALKKKEFREFLKNEALKEVDGDYDVYLRDFDIKNIGSKRALDYLFEELSEEERTQELTRIEAEDQVLIIGIPVNIELWDTEKDIPPVVFVPVNYKEGTESITAYDKNGKTFELPLLEDPEFPIIVVRPSDRVDKHGEIRYGKKDVVDLKGSVNIDETLPAMIMDGEDGPPCEAILVTQAPGSLNAESNGAGMELNVTWSSVPHADRYALYYFSTQTSSWWYYGYSTTTSKVMVMPSSGAFTSIRVRGYNCEGSGPYSYFNLSGCRPNAPSPASSKSDASNQIDVDWEYVPDATRYKILYKINTESNYDEVIINSPSTTFYQLSNLLPGYFYDIQVFAINGCGISAEIYKGNFASPRTRGYKEVIDKVKFTSSALSAYEDMLHGAPEWEVKVIMGDNTSATVIKTIYIDDMRRRDKNEIIDISDRLIINWDPNQTEFVMAYQWVEDDADGDGQDINISSQYTDEFGNLSISHSYKWKVDNIDKVVGKSLVYYWTSYFQEYEPSPGKVSFWVNNYY